MMSETIAIASDHAGLNLKTALKAHAESLGFAVEDLGTHGEASVDYPDYAAKLCTWIKEKPGRCGVLVCGSGIGMSMAANRFPGIRAALTRSGLEAELSRKHNDANVLCLGERISGIEVARECFTRFMATAFEGGRHAERVEKMK